jgi:pimeloyl-ACP methyl ester carboxylesterase
VELAWDVPFLRALYERIASFARLIHFDKRGTGMSDAADAATPLEVRMDDVRAVMDSVGSQRAVIFGVSEGAPMSILFAATYPERTLALVVQGGEARALWAHDYPWGEHEADVRAALDAAPANLNDPQRLKELAREASPDATDAELTAIVNYFRHGGSPGARLALFRMNMLIDVRDVLSAIRVPTLVMHHAEDPWIPVGAGRFLAQRSPVRPMSSCRARSTSLRSPTRAGIWTSCRRSSNVCGRRRPTRKQNPIASWRPSSSRTSRVRASALRRWATADGVSSSNHELVRRQLVRYRGVEVDTAGDGFFASFDGPARAIRCACAISESVGELGLDVRAGLHTGECEVVDGKVAGIAVHTGARVASRADPGEVLVSNTVKDLVAGSGIRFEDRGAAQLKGIPGEWRLFAVDRSGPQASA